MPLFQTGNVIATEKLHKNKSLSHEKQPNQRNEIHNIPDKIKYL